MAEKRLAADREWMYNIKRYFSEAENLTVSKAVKRTAPDPESVWRELYDWILCLLVALILCILVFSYVVHPIDVVGTSMMPTLRDREKLLVSDLFYRPAVGDIVVFKKDEYDPSKSLVKRIIAVEDQEVNIDFENGIVYIDGRPISEPYISELTFNKLDFIGPKTVPKGCVFVMGDNRNASIDSRKSEIGMLDTRLILGRAYCVVYPLSSFRVLR